MNKEHLIPGQLSGLIAGLIAIGVVIVSLVFVVTFEEGWIRINKGKFWAIFNKYFYLLGGAIKC